MSQQHFIAFLSQEFLRQALKLGWIFTHVSQRELIDFTVCRLEQIKSLSPTFFFSTQHFSKKCTKSFMKLPKVWQGVPLILLVLLAHLHSLSMSFRTDRELNNAVKTVCSLTINMIISSTFTQ